MAGDKPIRPEVRTVDDLDRVVRSIGRHFETDEVIVIGSQAILVLHAQSPAILRTSGEIDAYPGKNQAWESRHPGELASDEINVWFGIRSSFHDTFGFYIDGVDEDTAKLPPGWRARAITRTVQDGVKSIRAVAPCLEDLIVSKLHRLDRKDRDFIRACHNMNALDVALIQQRLAETEPEADIAARANMFLEMLS